MLARALLRAHDHRLPLLPGGEAAIARIGTIEVDNGREKKRVTEYEITGLELQPDTIWLEDDGEAFCVGITILAGWERAGAALAAAEGKRAGEQRQKLMATLARTPSRPLAMVHARLFDAESARVRPETTVVVEHGRFVAVGPDGAVAPPAGAEIIDATGKTLLPGLWDLHVHPDEAAGLMMIAGGVTTARDMAGSAKGARPLLDAFEAGSAVGPRVVRVGLLSNT